MAETGNNFIFDLNELSARAEILRGSSSKLVGKVLMDRAVYSGLNRGQVWSTFRDNTTFWRNTFRNSTRGYAWQIALGAQGRNASLVLEDGQLDAPRRDFGELQLVGYLSRLEAVTIEHVSANGIESQVAHGTIDCLRTSLTVRQSQNHINATGFGPIG